MKFVGNQRARFTYDDHLDDTQCVPKCVSHNTFGLQYLEVVTCASCKSNENTSGATNSFTHLVYVSELFSVKESSTRLTDFEGILKSMFDNDQRERL